MPDTLASDDVVSESETTDKTCDLNITPEIEDKIHENQSISNSTDASLDDENAQLCGGTSFQSDNNGSEEELISPQDEPPGILLDSSDVPAVHSVDVIPAPDLQSPGWSLRAKVAILVCLSSCCCNVVFLELLVRKDSGIGNLVTFSQFLIISVEGFIFTTKFGTVKPKVPFKSWLVLVIMYFLVSVTNNYALSYHIPMPLHMIFRAGSLMVNMLMGMVLLGKRYKTVKYVSVVMITFGIATCTVMSATSRVSLKTGKAVFSEPLHVNDTEKPSEEVNKLKQGLEKEAESVRFNQLLVGIGLLTFALFLSARMGIYQEVIFGRFGKHAKEALFYTHALPLPGFLLLAPDIYHHWQICMASEPMALPFLGTAVPVMVLHLLCNVVLQYLCISAVFVLTSECTSLTASLVLTFRKFLSLLFSIWYFQNPFTLQHWIGTCFVFCGIILFTDIPGYFAQRRLPQNREKID